MTIDSVERVNTGAAISAFLASFVHVASRLTVHPALGDAIPARLFGAALIWWRF